MKMVRAEGGALTGELQRGECGTERQYSVLKEMRQKRKKPPESSGGFCKDRDGWLPQLLSRSSFSA